MKRNKLNRKPKKGTGNKLKNGHQQNWPTRNISGRHQYVGHTK